jgi:hypothetical protein
MVQKSYEELLYEMAGFFEPSPCGDNTEHSSYKL